jgi:hypothetical protein
MNDKSLKTFSVVDIVCVMTSELDLVDTVNRCNISEMEKVGTELDPDDVNSCQTFAVHVNGVHAALIHTYRIVSYVAIRETDPGRAAEHWKKMSQFCDLTIKALKKLKDKFPNCGTNSVYDLALDYKLASDERYCQNLRDSECQNLKIPAGLFQTKS